MLGKSIQQEAILTAADECDLARAVSDQSLSSSAMDEKGEAFHATLDRILFEKPADIVSTVLTANGYAVNIENILSCIDQLIFGVRGRISGKQSESGRQQVRSYLPCITFRMPSKGRIGPLLKKFYQEIEAYEAEVERLQGKRDPLQSSEKEQSKQDLREEIKHLSAENRDLRNQIDSLSKTLTTTQASIHAAERAIATGNVLPEEIRVATVKDVLPADRIIVLRSGRKTMTLPISTLPSVPKPGDQCLVAVKDGICYGAFLYENQGMPFTREIATVLSIKGDVIKIRRRNRSHTILTAISDNERGLFSQLTSGSQLLLTLVDKHVIGLELCADFPTEHFTDKIQEEIATHQIGVRLSEAEAHDEIEEFATRGEAS